MPSPFSSSFRPRNRDKGEEWFEGGLLPALRFHFPSPGGNPFSPVSKHSRFAYTLENDTPLLTTLTLSFITRKAIKNLSLSTPQSQQIALQHWFSNRSSYVLPPLFACFQTSYDVVHIISESDRMVEACPQGAISGCDNHPYHYYINHDFYESQSSSFPGRTTSLTTPVCP